MGLGVELGEGNALPLQVGEMGVLDDFVEVLSLLGASVMHPALRGLKQNGWEARQGKARRTWFSSHMVMKRSKDRPPSTIVNF